MTITPLEASVPYSVAADGPFTISMLSISLGLMSCARLWAPPPVKMFPDSEPLSERMRTPSIT
ncbi:MAG: hypothetical protein IPK33_00035 [Gemmatimonadetes bacterium]|nr:hypothetical protein [Gemmatimonadota bacterium]